MKYLKYLIVLVLEIFFFFGRSSSTMELGRKTIILVKWSIILLKNKSVNRQSFNYLVLEKI